MQSLWKHDPENCRFCLFVFVLISTSGNENKIKWFHAIKVLHILTHLYIIRYRQGNLIEKKKNLHGLLHHFAKSLQRWIQIHSVHVGLPKCCPSSPYSCHLLIQVFWVSSSPSSPTTPSSPPSFYPPSTWCTPSGDSLDPVMATEWTE